MSSGVLRCDADVQVTTDGAPVCTGAWTLVPVPGPFELSQIDPVTAGQFFGVGFALVIPIWFTSMCCKAVLSMLDDK